jgi:hypothetical protein
VENAMNIDLNKALEQASPWDFSITIGGRLWPTVRLSNEKFARLYKYSAEQSGQESREIVGEIFANPKPDIASLDYEQLVAIVSLYTAYIVWRARAVPGIFASTIQSILQNMSAGQANPDRSR